MLGCSCKGSREAKKHIFKLTSTQAHSCACSRAVRTYNIYVLRIVHLVFRRGSIINNIIAIILVSRVRHWLHVNIVHTVRDLFDGLKKSSRNGLCIHML